MAWKGGLPLLLVLALSSCDASEAADPPAPYSGTTPLVDGLSRADIEALKDALSVPPSTTIAGPTTSNDEASPTTLVTDDDGPPSLPLPASVFDSEASSPNVDDPQWMNAMDVLLEVRDLALANGWSVLIEGFTDTRGSADYNLELSQARADATRLYVIDVLDYPESRVSAVGRGEGGSSDADRRVVISFVPQAKGD